MASPPLEDTRVKDGIRAGLYIDEAWERAAAYPKSNGYDGSPSRIGRAYF